jgi:3-mercaptopyruvate sulfurtransferase SseA
MRLWGLMAGLLLVAAAILSGCSKNNQPANNAGNVSSNAPINTRNVQPDNVRRVTIAELRDMMDQGKAIVVDVRGDEPYKQEHIKGAISVPESQLNARLGEFPKDKLIVFYCS